MSTSIHIVFRVINFLHSQQSISYSLASSESLLLISLASHKGKKGICPSIDTLCSKLKASRWSIERGLKSLENKKLLYIKRSSGKYNHYYLSEYLLNFDINSEQNTAGESQENSSSQPENVNNNIPTPCTDARGQPLKLSTDPVHGCTGTPCIRARGPRARMHGDITNNQLNNNRESTRKRGSPSLSVFSPNDENQFLAKDLNLDLEEEVLSFTERHKGKKSQYEFSRWIKNSYQYLKKIAPKAENKPAIRFFESTRVKPRGGQLSPYYEPEISDNIIPPAVIFLRQKLKEQKEARKNYNSQEQSLKILQEKLISEGKLIHA